MSIVTAIAGALLFFLFIGPLCASAFGEIKKTIAEYRLRKPRKEDYVYQQKYTDLVMEHNRLKRDYQELLEKTTPPESPFWTDEMRTLYRPHRLKLAQKENIASRFGTISPSFSVHVRIPPAELKKQRDAHPDKHIPPYYETSLTKCTCDDFKYNTKRKSACKHMFALALHLGLINEQGEFTEKSE